MTNVCIGDEEIIAHSLSFERSKSRQFDTLSRSVACVQRKRISSAQRGHEYRARQCNGTEATSRRRRIKSINVTFVTRQNNMVAHKDTNTAVMDSAISHELDVLKVHLIRFLRCLLCLEVDTALKRRNHRNILDSVSRKGGVSVNTDNERPLNTSFA